MPEAEEQRWSDLWKQEKVKVVGMTLVKDSMSTFTCMTVVLWRPNSSRASCLGLFLNTEGTTSSRAPDDKARNISTTEGSKVRGEARNTTSSAVT